MKLSNIYKYFEVQCFYDGLNIKKTEFKKFLRETLDLDKLKKADENELAKVYLSMFPFSLISTKQISISAISKLV